MLAFNFSPLAIQYSCGLQKSEANYRWPHITLRAIFLDFRAYVFFNGKAAGYSTGRYGALSRRKTTSEESQG